MTLDKIIILAALCAVHLIICVIAVFTGKMAKSERLAFLPLALALPVFGAALVIISRLNGGEKRAAPVNDLYRRTNGDLSPLASSAEKELPSVAPFEEIMLINGESERREAMMYILRRDPARYLEMLKTARIGADTEITHYATAAIMEVQREFELSLQRAQTAYLSQTGGYEKNDTETGETDTIDIETIDNYIDILTAYIKSGLLQGNALDNLRFRLADALEHKLTAMPESLSAYQMLIDAEIDLRRYDNASRIAGQMRAKWPSAEISWIKSLHACMGAGDSAEKAKLMARLLNADINWSRAGREVINYLCGSRLLRQSEPLQDQDVQLAAK